jgi:para-aminobenzoate synthetase component I
MRQIDDSRPFQPLVHELIPSPDPVEVFRRFQRLPHCLFLDSALREPELGRYSFLAADPCEFWTLPAGHPDPLGFLHAHLAGIAAARVEDLPPFQGGVAGLLGYDLNRSLERIAAPRNDEFQIPGLAMGLYDVVVAFDHAENRAWIVSQGLPERESARRLARAAARLDQFRTLVAGPAHEHAPDWPPDGSVLQARQLVPQFRLGADPDLTSNFPPRGYHRAVRRAVEYILAGDVFQVNLAQRLLYPARHDSVSLYLRLRRRNPAPFAGFFDLGVFQIVSASPERFLAVRGGHVETRPIKGTRQRCGNPEADLFAAGELRDSDKDRAENIMIVDLLRNDLSRVCRCDSVQVRELCRLETYPFVHHLVSVVVGELASGRAPLDLVRAAFPGGSITGAPKVRAMEIIQELEPTARGAYCGSLGYLGLDGSVDLSILIRTITAGRGWWQMPVGGGIVAHSDPEREYHETMHKAVGLLRSLR